VVELSRFVVLSTPTGGVAGQDLNPAADWSNRRVISEMRDRTGLVPDLEAEGNRTVQALGESRRVSTYTGTAQVLGQPVDVRVHVASFTHEGDVVVAVAVHPEDLDETDTVDALFSGLQHSGE